MVRTAEINLEADVDRKDFWNSNSNIKVYKKFSNRVRD